jgi:Protein of unknown function (DUF4054)
MGVVVPFNYQAWIASYPELTYVDDKQAMSYFGIAGSLHRNDGGGPVDDPVQQLALLNMVTAHLAKLYAPNADGTPNTAGVGRVSDATQGSVSVSLDYGTVSSSQAFWLQTKYGALYWQATSAFRTMRYMPYRRSFSPFPWRRRWY